MSGESKTEAAAVLLALRASYPREADAALAWFDDTFGPDGRYPLITLHGTDRDRFEYTYLHQHHRLRGVNPLQAKAISQIVPLSQELAEDSHIALDAMMASMLSYAIQRDIYTGALPEPMQTIYRRSERLRIEQERAVARAIEERAHKEVAHEVALRWWTLRKQLTHLIERRAIDRQGWLLVRALVDMHAPDLTDGWSTLDVSCSACRMEVSGCEFDMEPWPCASLVVIEEWVSHAL